MATVYAATHRNGKDVALKLLHPEIALVPDVRSRFLREGYLANKVRHAGAVSVLDDDVTEDGEAFLVMELLSGVTVQEMWEQRGGRLHAGPVAAIVLQVLDVVAAAHAQGIIHRDLKPANLFVTHDGEVKVLDFGIARMRAVTPASWTTNFGTVLGTPAFMAPEQAMGRAKEVDETTDLWATASVAFALLVGDVVHPAETNQETLVYAATRHARSILPFAPDTPPLVAAVFDRALLFDRAARWGSAVAMREALVRAASEAFGEAPGASVLRDTFGRTRKTPITSSSAATLDLVIEQGERAAPSSDPFVSPAPPAEHVTASPGASLSSGLSISQRTSSPRAGQPVARALPTRRPQKRTVAAIVALAVACLAVPRFHLSARATPEAQASPLSAEALTVAGSPPAGPVEPDAGTTVLAEPIVGVPERATASRARAVATASSPTPRANPGVIASAVVVAPPPTAPRMHCTPPFVIDRVNGRKKWKLECL
jgi:serine/threonine-protein kinase